MSLRHLNFMNWPISSKLTAIFLLAVLLPALLIVVPFSVQRRNAMLREHSEMRLETLGPAQVVQTRLALISLSSGIERLVLDPVDYDQLERYFYVVRWSSVSEKVRQELQQFITGKIQQYMINAPSLSRVRLYDLESNLLIDVSKDGQQIITRFSEAEQARTPANAVMEAGNFGLRTTVTGIYSDASGNPSLDVLYTLRPPWDAAGVASIVGQMVFTQNLLLAAQDPLLPDLYALLRDFPAGEQSAHVFLLDADGQLVMPDSSHSLLFDGSRSVGFQRAQNNEARVSTYTSPLLQTDVIGYHAAVTFPDGPRFTFLVETPLDDINRQAVEEGFLALLWVGVGTVILGLISVALGTLLIARPIARLTSTARQVAGGQFDVPLPRLTRRDEIGVLSHTLNEMSGQLLSAIHELEDRVAERTHNLEAMLEVSRVLASIRDLDTLLEEVVNLIRDQFEPVYHAQVFLTDAQTNRASLRASTGAAGRLLLQRGHYLEIGSQSVIGSVTATGHAVVALDTSHNPVHQRNEFLPNTRAEMALPLRISKRIIGALDLQSTQPDAFSEQDVELFQAMADQISVAIENTALFDESLARLAEIERLNRSLTEAAWREVGERRGPQPLSASVGQSSPSASWSPLQREAMHTRQIAEHVEGERVTLAVPVLLREQVMGAIEWQVLQAHYTPSTRQTALELSDRLALAAENIRLFEQSLQAVQREQLVNQISSKLVGTTDIDLILQTAVRELGLALRASQMVIQLHPSDQTPNGNSDDPANGASA